MTEIGMLVEKLGVAQAFFLKEATKTKYARLFATIQEGSTRW